MPGQHTDIIRFLNACYQADNREQTLWDIFASEHEYLKILNDEESKGLYADNCMALNDPYASKLDYAVNTYRREKTLTAGFLFVTGRINSLAAFSKTSKKICSPLILAEVGLTEANGVISVISDSVEYRWNTSLLAQLVSDRDELHDLDSIFNFISDQPPDIEAIGSWIQSRESENRLKVIDPAFYDEDGLKKGTRRRKDSGLVLSGGAMLLLTKRSRTSRGIIDELGQIEDADQVSAPLKVLCNREPIKRDTHGICRPDNVPGILSTVQEKSLQNAAHETLSQLIGPPGTGKSYTIACIALERFLAGESVLIVSENEHAVDVIQEKLVEQLGVSANAIVRAGSKNYHKQLITTIENLTRGIGVEKAGEPVDRQLTKKKKEIKQKEKQFITLSKRSVKEGVFLDSVLSKGRVGVIAALKIWLQKKRNKKYGLLHEQLQTIQDAYKERESLLAQKIEYQYKAAVEEILAKHRSDLVTFLQGLKARTSSKQEKMFSEIDYSILLKTMPVWLCSIQALSKALPLKSELFDLVIIDEATQCDIASAIPALFRAKKAVVSGDPKQLRHVSFLSQKKQEMIGRKLDVPEIKNRIDFREHSMIDFADQAIASQEAVTMLDEHYRSLPEIIQFSNTFFYNDSLRIMTEQPTHADSVPVEVIRVDGGIRENGVNQKELEALFKKLEAIVESQKTIPEAYKASIGILSFFRDQAEELQKTLLDRFSLDTITAHKLRAGTPYAFQGEERDIMMISCAVGDGEKSGTWTYLNRQDVFNVAITRARYSQCIFLSADASMIPGTSLLKAYLNSFKKKNGHNHSQAAERDKNIDDLAEALLARGLNVLKAFPIAGIPMDLVVTTGDGALAVDVIGFPGAYEDVFQFDRYKIFERAGMPIFPLTYTAFIYNRDEVLDTLCEMIEKLSENKRRFMISKETLTSHWHKLLAVNPDLAKKVRHLELSLSMHGLDDAVKQTGRFVERYQKFVWLLGEKLNPEELTYSRYASAAEQLLLSGLSNLSSVVLMKQSLPADDANGETTEISDHVENQIKEIHRLLAANESAIKKLEEITLEWGRVNTGPDDGSQAFEISLSEIERLIENVKQYGV